MSDKKRRILKILNAVIITTYNLWMMFQHEILVLSQMIDDVEQLRQMVCEVNETLKKEDRLSNQVYRYRCGSGSIEIA